MTANERIEQVRSLLAAPVKAVSAGAESPDYVPPGPGRVIPTPTRDQALFEGGVTHPGLAWIRCVSCPCPAWRDHPGVDSWSCTCRSHHAPTQVLDAAGMVRFEWRPFVMSRSARPLVG